MGFIFFYYSKKKPLPACQRWTSNIFPFSVCVYFSHILLVLQSVGDVFHTIVESGNPLPLDREHRISLILGMDFIC